MLYDKQHVEQLKKEKKYEELFEYLSSFAQSDNPKALNDLANCYYYGWGTEKDYVKSFYYDEIAVKTEDPDSIAVLGYDYEQGVGVVADITKALSLYEKAVSLGSALGMTHLGLCYENGTGVDKDCEKAVSLYQQAAEQGFAKAQRYLGLCYEKGIGTQVDKEKAVVWYQKAAEQDNRIAQRWLAMCYEFGDGVDKNIEKAIEWYLRAIENDDDISRVCLADIYYKNFDEEEKDIIALDYLQTAVENLETDSYYYYLCCHKLARYYENGYIVELDPKKAFEYDKIAAEGGIDGSMVALAYFYRDGIGTTKNDIEAARWFERGIELKEDSFDKGKLHLTLAELYNSDFSEAYDSQKSELHYSKAFDCFTNLIENDSHNAEAELELGELYYQGNGVELNRSKAFSIFEKLSEHTDKSIMVRAKYHLAKCYFLGHGVSENLKKGFQVIKNLAKDGHVFSIIYEVYCYLYGLGVRRNYFKAKKLLRRLEKYDIKNNSEYCEEINFYKGIIQYHGLGTKKNVKKAKEFFDKSTALGRILYSPICDGDYGKTNLLGKIYYSKSLAFGYMLFGNKKIAKELLKLAAVDNSITVTGAKYLFDIIAKKIILTSRSRKQAFDIIVNKTGDVQDDATILRIRGKCFYYGFGTKKDYSNAIYNFEKAADLGDDMAKVYLAICYANGYGVNKSLEKARQILDKASIKDYYSTIFKALYMYAGRSGYKKDKETALELLKKFYDDNTIYNTLSTMRGDLYIDLFIDMQLLGIQWTIDRRFTTIRKILVLIVKFFSLLLFKNPDSSNLSKKEMLRISLSQIQMLIDQGKGNVEKQTEIASMLSQIQTNTDTIPQIIEQQKEMLGLMHSIIDLVAEQKNNLPTENNIRFLDEDQLEQIQARFVKETAAKIVDSLQTNTVSVEKEENLLKGMFGEYWSKLDSYTRKSLLSAKVLFNQCQSPAFSKLDHSGIVISATSALENELYYRLFIGYQSFMKRKFGESSYDKWPEILVFHTKKGELVPSKDFTLGSLPYLLGGSDKNKEYLTEYLQSILSDNYSHKGILAFTKPLIGNASFVSKCEDIRRLYRNAAAHKDLVNRAQAEACCNDVIGPSEASEKIGQVQGLLYDLVQMTENFK